MTDRIRTLVKRISETRPIQSGRRQSLMSELRALRGDLDERTPPEQVRSLEAAMLLLEFMSRSEAVATADTIQIVATLVGIVDERSLRGPQPSASHAGAPQSSVLHHGAPQHAATQHGTQYGATQHGVQGVQHSVQHGAPTPRASEAEVVQHQDLRLTHEFLLGSILMQAGVISADSLARALQLHTSSGVALGQCLVQLGAATSEQISRAIAYQDKLREEEPSTRAEKERPVTPRTELRMSPKQKGFVQSVHAQVLGEILIRLGSVTREQLERALQLQRAASVQIGQALVESGAASWEQIKKALEVQRQLRGQRRAS